MVLPNGCANAKHLHLSKLHPSDSWRIAYKAYAYTRACY